MGTEDDDKLLGFDDDDGGDGLEEKFEENLAAAGGDPDPTGDIEGEEIEIREEEEGSSRKAKKRERGKLMSSLEEMRSENQQLRDQINQLTGMAQTLLSGAPQEPQQQSQQQQHDPVEYELNAIAQQRRLLKDAYNARRGQLTPQEARQMEEQYEALEGRQQELRTWRTMQQYQQQSGPPVDERQMYARFTRQRLHQANPDVYGNARFTNWAGGRFQQRVEELKNDRGELPPGFNPEKLHDEVMEETRRHFRLPGARSERSEGQQRRLSGSGRGASGGGGGRKSTGGPIRMTKEFKAMAETMYSDLPPRKAHQKWVNTVGKRMREQGIA